MADAVIHDAHCAEYVGPAVHGPLVKETAWLTMYDPEWEVIERLNITNWSDQQFSDYVNGVFRALLTMTGVHRAWPSQTHKPKDITITTEIFYEVQGHEEGRAGTGGGVAHG